MTTPLRLLTIGFCAAALAACSNDREAEADTPVAEAEVSTELPASVVSDNQLQAAANSAAQVASSPPPSVVMVPVPSGQGAASGSNSAAPAQPGNNMQKAQ